jgi:hypothetical protein
MKKQIPPPKHPPEELAEVEGAATRLEKHLDRLGITEKSLLDAAARVREGMLTEVYGLEDKALHEQKAR